MKDKKGEIHKKIEQHGVIQCIIMIEEKNYGHPDSSVGSAFGF